MTAFGGVYYQNALGSVGLLALCIVTNEFHDVDVTSWNAMVWGPLLTSCLLHRGGGLPRVYEKGTTENLGWS